jgi:hypothetical protein
MRLRARAGRTHDCVVVRDPVRGGLGKRPRTNSKSESCPPCTSWWSRWVPLREPCTILARRAVHDGSVAFPDQLVADVVHNCAHLAGLACAQVGMDSTLKSELFSASARGVFRRMNAGDD